MTVPTKKVIKVWEEKGKTDNIINVASAIDLDKFKITDNDLDKVKEIRNKYNINDDFVLGFVGRISYEKNIQEIIEYI
jgi:glycosyltransferase involved in cell wall biosynthesis